jgi:hypothetical protein
MDQSVSGPSSSLAGSALPPLGFIAVDVHFPRPPGDPFNEQTWPFPLLRDQVAGSKLDAIVTKSQYPAEFIDNFVAAGQRLADRGCVGLITSCGFLAMAQPDVAARLPIPVATSALIQIPSILAFLPPNRSVGVITYDATRLGPLHLSRVGIADVQRVHVVGPPADGKLRSMIRDGAPYSHAAIEAELVQTAEELVQRHPSVAAVVLECTQMPPFAEKIQAAISLPVYDAYSLGMWFYSALTKRTPVIWKSKEQS